MGLQAWKLSRESGALSIVAAFFSCLLSIGAIRIYLRLLDWSLAVSFMWISDFEVPLK